MIYQLPMLWLIYGKIQMNWNIVVCLIQPKNTICLASNATYKFITFVMRKFIIVYLLYF
jgi:hypothetical protein